MLCAAGGDGLARLQFSGGARQMLLCKITPFGLCTANFFSGISKNLGGVH